MGIGAAFLQDNRSYYEQITLNPSLNSPCRPYWMESEFTMITQIKSFYSQSFFSQSVCLFKYMTTWLKPFRGLSITIGAVTCVGISSSLAIALPQPLTSTSNTEPTRNIFYTPPPDAGTPETTGGTGSRGGCEYQNASLPLASLVGQPHLMLTTSDRPVLWAYIPYSPTDAPTGTLSLQQGDDEIYRGTFTLTSTPGVIGIPLPETAPALAVDQAYAWFIDIYCPMAVTNPSQSHLEPDVVGGWVKRVVPTEALAIALGNASSDLDIVAAYGTHHIWYDLLTHLARVRIASAPNAESTLEIESAWSNILGDSGARTLTQWATQPIVEEVVVNDVP